MSQDLPLTGHSTNLVGLPTGLIASCAFNDHPLPIHISGVREMHPGLFNQLKYCSELSQAAGIFQDYLAVAFDLDGRRSEPSRKGRRFRSSYLKLLAGWGMDSNSPQGAVLKGWVESRFGLFPTFHKEPLTRFPSPAWITYIEEKMASRFHNNSINAQLDLLYEFCQWVIARFKIPARRHVTLYRGENRFDEHRPVGPRAGRTATLRLNNLVSFSASRETAGCFGDFILTAQVPVVKILFFNDLLPHHPLQGEAEYLVIGGEYRVEVSYF